MTPSTNRRHLLKLATAAASTLWLPRSAWSQVRFSGNPFALGVASGSPTHDSLVLWTRLVQTGLFGSSTLGTAPVTVRWEIADDEGFTRIVQSGQAQALAELAHSVHVEVAGLASDRWYFYRFMAGDAVSPVGRTRTFPTPDAPAARLRVAYASCQRWEHGYFSAWRHLRDDQPDAVLFLGDYIYEYASAPNAVRQPTGGWVLTLDDYRARYALHRSEHELQAAHAACPWLVTWDDHEVQNDYAGLTPGNSGPPVADFAARRAAAYQAFYEHMPLRASSLAAPGFALHRRLDWGQLAHIHLLDTRQYRNLQACRSPRSSGAGATRPDDCPALQDPARSMLGPAQEQWLDQGLALDARTRARWSVLAQTTLFSPRHYPSGLHSTDTWDGYPAARERLTASIERHTPARTVVLGGDIHQNYVCRVPKKAQELDGPAVASEFCGTSISSRSGTTQEKLDAIVRHNPHVLLARCGERGYGIADITPKLWTTRLQVVQDPMRMDSAVHTLARFVVEPGHPGPIREA